MEEGDLIQLDVKERILAIVGIHGEKKTPEEMEEAVRKADPAPTFNDFGRKGSKPMWLDHLMFRGATAKSFIVVDENKYGVQYISDHYPIVADFIIPVPKK